MQLKDNANIRMAILEARGGGFATGDDGAVEKVRELCAEHVGNYESVNAIPWPILIQLALQLVPILFDDGGFTVEKLQAILKLIASIFTA